MALPIDRQLRYWGIALAIFLVVLWFLGGVLLPFVIGAAIAYFLDPVADRLETWGFSRVWATVSITLVALIVFVVMALAIVPLMIEQALALVNTAPQAATDLQAYLTQRFPALADGDSVIRRSLQSLGATIQARGGELVRAHDRGHEHGDLHRDVDRAEEQGLLPLELGLVDHHGVEHIAGETP